MWRIWLIIGHTAGFVGAATLLMWFLIEPDRNTKFSTVLGVAIILFCFVSYFCMEASSYSEANRPELEILASKMSGWFYFLGGLTFGAFGISLGTVMCKLISLFDIQTMMPLFFCPGISLILTINWAHHAPTSPKLPSVRI